MITGYILYLKIDTFLDVVVKNDFPLLSVGWYLFRVVTGNRYLPRGSNKNTIYITSTSNVSVARWVIPLVNIPLLDLVMIHWIRWIQGKSFRKNSIKGDCYIWIWLLLWRLTIVPTLIIEIGRDDQSKQFSCNKSKTSVWMVYELQKIHLWKNILFENRNYLLLLNNHLTKSDIF